MVLVSALGRVTLVVFALSGGDERVAPPRSDQTDVYHSTRVDDPWRALEDTDAISTRRWVDAEDARTRTVLDALPGRDAIERRLTELWDRPRASAPARAGSRLFFAANDGLTEHDVVRVLDEETGVEETILDPNAWSARSDVSLASWSVSRSGRYVAFARSVAGSDWWEWRVLDTKSGLELEDRLDRARYVPASWRADDAGFFYARVPAGDGDDERVPFAQLHYHALGTPVEEDVLVHDTRDAPWAYVRASVDSTGRFVVIDEFDTRRSSNRVLLVPVDRLDARPRHLIGRDRWQFRYVGDDGDRYWFWTNHGDAAAWKVVGVDRETADGEAFEEVIAPDPLPLQSARRVGGRFLCRYLRDATSELRIVDVEAGRTRVVTLPGTGTVSGTFGYEGSPEAFFTYSDFARPEAVIRLDVRDASTSIFRAPEVEAGPGEVVCDQVFFESVDGTRVPMFIVHRRDVDPNGARPVLLYGYGGFYSTQTPGFSPVVATWIERGGVYALANLRGGGEYGLAWHQGGMRANKQNVFDDFIAAGEHLIESGWTSPERLGICGKSNGGLLVGACLTQRPDLFGACVAQVGLFDMLRYHRIGIGNIWASEYGTADDRRMFRALYAYSPLHNVKDGRRYPPTLLLTGDHDDRVPPGHTYKFAAALMAAQDDDAPVFLRVERRTGHGAGTPTSKSIAEWADILAFLERGSG